MVFVAKARSLDSAEYSNLRPLSTTIRTSRAEASPIESDPLLQWFTWETVLRIRNLEAGIQKVLISDGSYRLQKDLPVDSVSNTAAFFYLALFRTTKCLARAFRTSNPTWIKTIKNESERLKFTKREVLEAFALEFATICPTAVDRIRCLSQSTALFAVGSSEELPMKSSSVDLMISSPPYCTRIDYAVATRIELAVLGYSHEFGVLRESLMGTSTVVKNAPPLADAWGQTCLTFLNQLSLHGSKASATYYLKSHVSYFNSLNRSIKEIKRVLKPGAHCHLVVQDSYYKNLHNDLPTIVAEMAENAELELFSKKSFMVPRTLAGVNPRVKAYRKTFGAIESVLSLRSVAH